MVRGVSLWEIAEIASRTARVAFLAAGAPLSMTVETWQEILSLFRVIKNILYQE